MILTRKQEEGLQIALDRYRHGEKYTVIAGYAGTGKSTLVKFILAAMEADGIDPNIDVANVAFTGKAATVLSRKGNSNCKTLHKLLYKAVQKPDGKYIYKPKLRLDERIIIVDECSMLDQRFVDQLLSYTGIYVIFCGDPG